MPAVVQVQAAATGFDGLAARQFGGAAVIAGVTGAGGQGSAGQFHARAVAATEVFGRPVLPGGVADRIDAEDVVEGVDAGFTPVVSDAAVEAPGARGQDAPRAGRGRGEVDVLPASPFGARRGFVCGGGAGQEQQA